MRRLHTTLFILTAIAALTPALAFAQTEPTSTAHVVGATSGNGRGFGIGATSFLQPNVESAPHRLVPNLLLTWGESRFHIDGLFGFYHEQGTDFDFGARGWYHLHAASSADFSVGGGLVITRRKNRLPEGQRGTQWDFLLDLGAQMRVFIVPNVALLGSAGMGIYIPDTGNTHISISGTLVGSVGLAYYFL
jgi:hypothetical protein